MARPLGSGPIHIYLAFGPPYAVTYNPPLQASAVNTNIVVNVPSFGSGNTASSTNAYGHYV